jgi:signal transduction histidine kinase
MLTLPLSYNAEPIGQLLFAPRTPGEPFSAADRRLLEDLARQVGVAAYAVQLTADLQRSRERLVSAREEERRRLRNDLHDGFGPVLSGLKLRAETARNLVQDNPEVDALLADIADRTESAVSDIRRLVYSLRPPALDDLGLIPALREVAAQTRLKLAIETPALLPALPAAIEVATYRIVQEALTNVARHARTDACRLRIWIENDALRIEVSDDGVGLVEDATAGVGLRSIRERAEELNGRADARKRADGGTVVTASLPLLRLPSTAHKGE